MAVEVVFYSLAPKPAASGDKTYAAAASGKVSRGRKWYRLECRAKDVYLFPDGTDYWAVGDWFDRQPAGKTWVAYTIDGVLYNLNNYSALDAVPGGGMARDNARSCYEHGRDGWVVFVPEEKENV